MNRRHLLALAVLPILAAAPAAAAQVTQPATTQPATTQPATTQPATTQPATTQPTTQPVDANPPAPGFNAEASDAKAIAIADKVMHAMGGRAAWDDTRYIRWTFFNGRRHLWDKHTGDVRVETGSADEPAVVLMNLSTGEGEQYLQGTKVVDEGARKNALSNGMSAWINDAYWLVMPYKLKDSGVTLTYKGEGELPDGRAADILTLTFEKVGRTPNNKYDVWVARDTSLVEQWAFYGSANENQPRFTNPWTDWQGHGSIKLSGSRGGRKITNIAVLETIPEGVMTDPMVTIAETEGHEVKAAEADEAEDE